MLAITGEDIYVDAFSVMKLMQSTIASVYMAALLVHSLTCFTLKVTFLPVFAHQ